jgi:hypothetical protein
MEFTVHQHAILSILIGIFLIVGGLTSKHLIADYGQNWFQGLWLKLNEPHFKEVTQGLVDANGNIFDQTSVTNCW